MAEALIYAAGGSVDTDSLTATSGDVVSPLNFYGSGSEEIQQGSIVNRGELNKVLGINETYVVPAGYYSGGKVSQSIPVLGTQRVTPTSKTQTLYTQGRYMGGDIIQNAIPNLVPENIKKGEYVGGVGPGTWEGYVVSDPSTFYYYGTFGPGVSFSVIPYASGDALGAVVLNKKNFNLVKPENIGERNVAGKFSSAIDITSKNTLKVNFGITSSNTTRKLFYVVGCRNSMSNYEDAAADKVFSSYYATSSETDSSELTIDLSTYSRSIYLYFYLECSQSFEFSVVVNSVQFT